MAEVKRGELAREHEKCPYGTDKFSERKNAWRRQQNSANLSLGQIILSII